MRKVTVAATQMIGGWNVEENIARGERLVREAAEQGAQIILLQELFERNYFCQKQKYEYLEFATTVEDNAAIKHFSKIAKELKVVLPISFYEKAGNCFYNTVAVIDADGSNLGLYRKSHIPDGPGYSEKFYFTPGDTGFKVWDTAYAKIGIGICWDQWFPEAARLMAMAGADMLIYPTAIGWTPDEDSAEKVRQREAWITVQRAHAIANGLPVISVNRVGHESDPAGGCGLDFWGSSFAVGPQGEFLWSASTDQEELAVVQIDLKRSESVRRMWP